MAMAIVLLSISMAGKGLGGLAPAEIAFLSGIILFFYSVLIIWRKVTFYFIMSFLFLILFALLWLVGIDILVKMNLHDKLAEDLGWSFGAFCFAAVITGIIGIFKYSVGWQRLPFGGAAFSMLAVFILIIPCLSPPPGISTFTIFSGFIILAMQFLITISLFITGKMNRDINWPTRSILKLIVFFLLALLLWEYYLTLNINITDDRGLPVWKGMYKITGFINLVIAVITFYSLKLIKSDDKDRNNAMKKDQDFLS